MLEDLGVTGVLPIPGGLIDLEDLVDVGEIGILDGGGTRGAELNFSDVCLLMFRGIVGGSGGSSTASISVSMRFLRSESELRRFFLRDLGGSSISVSGSPIVSRLDSR